MICEYCTRPNHSEDETCKGCGAPLRITPALIYDPRILDSDAIRLLGRPGVNIPITHAFYVDGGSNVILDNVIHDCREPFFGTPTDHDPIDTP